MFNKKILLGAALALTVFGFTATYQQGQVAHSVSVDDFDAGNIIDDGLFFNGGDMTTEEIQAFLESRVPDCDTQGEQIIYGDTTRAEYAATRDEYPPFDCLRDYGTDYEVREADLLCDAIPAGYKTVAQVLHEVSEACDVSAKALIVLLEKESSLITDDWPWVSQYRHAMGYGCPDTGPNFTANCDSAYYGFYNQVYNAARQLQNYVNNPSWFRYRAGETINIQYHPNPDCGSSPVTIENGATAALYNYTPYQPNQAALDATPGVGDSCSAYGNRNFWYIWRVWFGATVYDFQFVDMDLPRWMQAKGNIERINIKYGASVGNTISAGTHIRFNKKITYNDTLYLQAQYDNNSTIVVPFSDLDNIDLIYEDMVTPRWMKLNRAYVKKHPVIDSIQGEKYRTGHVLYFDQKILINGHWRLRDSRDTFSNKNYMVPLLYLDDMIQPAYKNFMYPRLLEARENNTSYVNLVNGEPSPLPALMKSEQRYFDKKLLLNNTLYVASSDDIAAEEVWHGTKYSDLQETVVYRDMLIPRVMKTTKSTKIINLKSGEIQQTIAEATELRFTTKAKKNGRLYLRTALDSEANVNAAILFSDLEEL